MVELSLVEDKTWKKDTMEMQSTRKNLWSGRLETAKATHHIINLKEETCPIHQQPYGSEHRSQAVLRKNIDKKLDAGLIEPASSE